MNKEKVQKIVINSLKKKSKKNIKPTTKFKDLKIEPLDFIKVVSSIEKQCNIWFLDCEVDRLDRVSDMVELVQQVKRESSLI